MPGKFFYLIMVAKNNTSQNVPIPASTAVTKLFSIHPYSLKKIESTDEMGHRGHLEDENLHPYVLNI